MKNIDENSNSNHSVILNNKFKTSFELMKDILCVYLPVTGHMPGNFEQIEELVDVAPDDYILKKFEEVVYTLDFEVLSLIHNDIDDFKDKNKHLWTYDIDSKEYLHFELYKKLGSQSYLVLRNDYLNLVRSLYAGSTKGKVIDKEVVYKNFIVTKFIDHTYRVFDVSSKDKVSLVNDIDKIELDRMLRF